MSKHDINDLVSLIARVNQLASQRGKKAALARQLNITRQQLNSWLSGHREPNGTITLQLLKWVTAEEATKRKTPGSASNTPKGKQTRRKKHDNESKSGPSS